MTGRVRTRMAVPLIVILGLFSSAGPATAQVDLGGDATDLGGGGGGWNFNRKEQCMMNKINKVRARKGLARLRWDKQMGYVARRHARRMAESRAVYHDANFGNEITRWRTLGQNTGGGHGCKKMFWNFMRSPAHRQNILGRWRYMGIGIDNRGGRLYVQQLFEWRSDPGNIYHYP